MVVDLISRETGAKHVSMDKSCITIFAHVLTWSCLQENKLALFKTDFIITCVCNKPFRSYLFFAKRERGLLL